MLHSGTRLDARQNPRFSISAPILFSWREHDRIRDESGITRNVSIKGIAVSTSECPTLNSTVDFELRLPKFDRHRFGLTIKAQGRVIRIEYSKGSNVPMGFSFSGGPWGIFESDELNDEADEKMSVKC